MKIRTSYVSNSSSSSFVAVGYLMDDRNGSIARSLISRALPKVDDMDEFLDEGYYDMRDYGYPAPVLKDGISVIIGDDENGIEEGKTALVAYPLVFDENGRTAGGECDIFELKEKLDAFSEGIVRGEKLKIVGGTFLC